jgi:hypothetical protein
LQERQLDALDSGGARYSLVDAEADAGRVLDMKRPDDRRLSTAEILLEEQAKAGEDVEQAERDLAWELGEGHGGDE